MYAPRPPPPNRDSSSPSPSPSPSPRLTNPLSGSSGIPLPRPRTQSSQSDRSRPASHHGSAHKSLNTNVVHRLRTDSNHSTNSHGLASGPSAAIVKPLGSLNEPQLTFNNPSPTARSATPTTNLSSSSIPSSASIQARPSSPSTHSFSTSSNPPVGNMVRRSSPLAQSNHSHQHSNPQPAPTDPPTRQPTPALNTSHSSPASYRNSSASTVTITSAQPPTMPTSISAARANQHDEEVEEDSDTTSDVDHRPPGHRSTPGTSVDSSTSNFTQPEDPSATGSPAFPDRTHHKHSKHSLSNKLRRALSINALQENMIHESIPELDPVIGHERLKSSSASIAGVPLSPSITTKVKAGRQSGASRRFGFLNSKSNSSTDNLSISSTVSSASVMIRKLGNLGKSARTKGVMGLTKIFKDKSEATTGESIADDNKGFSTKPDRFKKSSSPSHHKNLASTSVAQVQAEVDRSLSVEYPGMTPAAAFIHKQKQQYAEQEAAAAAAAAAASAAEALNQARASESVKSKGRAASVGGASSLTPGSASEARKKMIEKEKEKIKSKKSRKWGFAGLGGSGAASEDLPASTSVEDLRRAPEQASDAEENEDWEENTVRGANMEGLIDSCIGAPRKSVEELRGDDDDDAEAIDEYDMESLFGNSSSNEGSSTRRAGLRPRPSKEAVPKKGILKNAQNFSQEHHLSPASFQSKLISAATTPDSPKPRTLAEDPAQSSGLPQLGMISQAGSTIDFGSVGPNLSLTITGAEIKDRRATFAQHLSVHTTWPPAIYDRRGELATCNRLTPTLAQRIKEEINAFKMEEMEVHHASRVHTHFFV